MARSDDSGSKTEKATPKKLRDARKKGDVPKSRDLTSTICLLFSFGVVWIASSYTASNVGALMAEIFSLAERDFATALQTLGKQTLILILTASAIVTLPIVAFGLLIEFMQIGPILTAEKINPKMSNLNPISGLKRMFGADNFVELLKSIAKTSILFFFCWVTIKTVLPDLVMLPSAEPSNILGAGRTILLYLLGWSTALFLLLSAFDVGYQRYSFGKKQMMSMRDIKQEHKDSEGDPQMKGRRQETAREWAQESATRTAEDASVLVVNPTHIAVAIKYDAESAPVPTVTAMGEDKVAVAMREAATKKGVPVVRNKAIARKLLQDAEAGDIVPRELFDSIAEIILWAKSVRERVEHEKEHRFVKWEGQVLQAPGEDMTQYPTNL
ncbi:MAG: type III secretion system export apparatus subunit SctU [Granulosicoccaceae bacterium]